ncbi:hypothetical protein SARC_12349 [Sphaeroforma arctica JP610]|uniref:NTF2 domain-containing protein n=1 Tax=Sphaeroforma arctica JP610 TaxID=667725 RepID=A0A0L0FGG7_9EUKA|nr:hypothetical protein SARC_12349 [Sphaeroforma arctica JP610]KNC75118.1 hypothetical protein SARC_12349 [Sphaeroforma arctica JP610]|eukprot:XP_014149020.1 hypothetical protein SARC_12349 [Sphaeroforma arctica JP610]
MGGGGRGNHTDRGHGDKGYSTRSSSSTGPKRGGGLGKRGGGGPTYKSKVRLDKASLHKALDGDVAMSSGNRSGRSPQRLNTSASARGKGRGAKKVGKNARAPRITDEEAKQILYNFLEKGYDPVQKSLDVSKFSKVHPRVNLWTFGAILVDLIKSECPEIEILNLSENKLVRLKSITGIVDAAPDLRRISLKDNELTIVSELRVLEGLNLKELIVAGNPLAKQMDYRDAITKMFKSLDMLDDTEITKFGVEEEINVPPTVLFYSGLPDAMKASVLAFLEKYYRAYDGADVSIRLQMSAFYSPNAVMSFTCPRQHSTARVSKGFNRQDVRNLEREKHNTLSASFEEYQQVNRNLRVVKSKAKREDTLFMGVSQIVAMLVKLPPTVHSLQEMMVDLWQVSPNSIMVKIVGPLQEAHKEAKNGSVKRMFARTLCLVPDNTGGMVIQNDMVTLTDPLTERMTRRKPLVASADVQPPAQATGQAQVPPTAAANLDPAQKAAVAALVQQSTLNEAGALHLLNFAQWNASESLRQYKELMPLGQIPPQYLRA